MNYLFIELSEASVRFNIYKDGKNTSSQFEFKDRLEHLYKEQLDSFFNKLQISTSDFDECCVSWSGIQYTLVPTNIFNESKAEAIFKLCYGDQGNLKDIDYSRIQEYGMVGVYTLPMWVKSYFIIKFPRAFIQHENTLMVRGLLSEPSFKQRCLLSVYQNHFTLAIVRQSKLVFYSNFEFNAQEDLIYHFMHSLKQNNTIEKNGKLDFHKGTGININLENTIEMMHKIADLKDFNIGVNEIFMLNSMIKCVS